MAMSAASADGGVEGRLDDGLDQRLLVRKDPEDGAFGDAGGLGDLAGGDRRAVGEDQRERRRDDLGPALGGGQRGGSGAAGGGGHARESYMSEHSLIPPELDETRRHSRRRPGRRRGRRSREISFTTHTWLSGGS